MAPGQADSESLVRFDHNDYSVPAQYAHRQLIVVATVEEVRLVFEDRLVAQHRRCWDREQTFFEPIHYLALLERKPGGFDYARPLENWQLPECFGLLRRRLEARSGRTARGRSSRCCGCWRRHSLSALKAAVEYASGHRRDRSPTASARSWSQPGTAGRAVLARRSAAPGARAGRNDRRLRLPALLTRSGRR